jgi:hypothetical protein
VTGEPRLHYPARSRAIPPPVIDLEPRGAIGNEIGATAVCGATHGDKKRRAQIRRSKTRDR